MNKKSLLLALALLAGSALAAEKPAKAPEPLILKPDMGYVLVRGTRKEAALATVTTSPILIRTLSDAEIDAIKKDERHAEANVVIPSVSQPYEIAGTRTTMLMPLKPGIYVLGGIAQVLKSGWYDTSVLSSLCLGTVMFEVKPGVITDMGTMLHADDRNPTDIPELTKVVSGKDLELGAMLWRVAVRPAGADTPMPDGLKSFPIAPAEYHAYGWMPNYLNGPLGRLVPLPGVLDYDADGNVIDLKAQPH